MSDNFVAALRNEKQKLQEALEKTVEYRRLQAVQATLAAYESGEKLPTAVPRPTSITPTVQAGTKTAVIMNVVFQYLEARGARATSGEILRAVQRGGVEIGGKNPASTMASYLSNSPLLDNVPGQGYGLKEWSKETEVAEPKSGQDTSATSDRQPEAQGREAGPGGGT